MKKRLLSIVLVIVLLCTMLPKAEANSYSEYIYNWGTRGDIADETDFARSTAEEWYGMHHTSYGELAQYSGSEIESDVPSSTLYKELQSLMADAHTVHTDYESLKSLLAFTDCQNGGGQMSSFFSGIAIGPYWDYYWNRQHIWPNAKSLYPEGPENKTPDETDIMMIRATAPSDSSSRGSMAFGESNNVWYYDPNLDSQFEYNLRGDCARIVLYGYVRWGNTQYMWGSSGVIESREILLKWMEEDPVDTWELGRNDSCQSITGTRNVFVDYPELGFLMLGADIPENYASPSGMGNASHYNITAQSNNISYGTVDLSGKTITATPATGYYVSGYTVTSGTATVTRDGNTFCVSAESDCTITINFCDHADTTNTVSVAATCTEIGFTAGVYCNICDTYISGHEVVTALGHSYTGVITDPTETEQGYTTYTCSVCGDSYVSDYTEALGETFYVSFSVPADVASIATMECGKNGITLPTANAPEGYSFLGWTTAAVEDTEAKPEILTGTYYATQNTTLYALYSYVEGGTGVSNYVKVTSAPADWSGEYVIVYESGSVIFDGSLTSLDANNNNQSVTITDSTIAADEADAYKVTIEAVTGGYSIQTASGYYIGATGNSNSLNSNKTTVYTNTLSMNTDGSVNVVGSGGAYLRYNTSASRFRYYKSSTYTGQKTIALYAKTESGTTYYTTLTAQEPTVELTHITLNPNKDALGYKAAATNLPEGAHVEISLWVTENVVVTQATDTLRLVNIMASNGGETTVYAKATIVDAEGNVIAESAVAQTTMRQTLETVNSNWTSYSTAQKEAVLALVEIYCSKMTDWKIDNIQ